ncbi:hypothetical protein HDU79_001277, partial [Rhizoclosmatium sp. JEL0117]
MLLSDRIVISELYARREYFENVIGVIDAPHEFRADIENRMSHLTLLFGVKTQEKRVFQ